MAAYLIAVHKVLDADTLNNVYLPKAVATLEPYAPEILAVDENIEVVEGNPENTRAVILKFKAARRPSAGTTRRSIRASSTCVSTPRTTS